MNRFLLEARSVGLTKGGTQILSGITFGIHAGEFIVLLGPSGSGKSTFLNTLAGILMPDEGEVLLRGESLGAASPDALTSALGTVPQDDVLHLDLRLRSALDYAARLRFPPAATEDEIAAAVARVLADVELEERADVRIRRLSGGQRKRANMAMELLRAPDVLLLDEPTSGLDPALERSTMELLRRLARGRRAVLATTHATASIELADVLLLIAEGHLAWAGPPAAALGYFRVEDPDLIFKRLRDAGGADWAARFAAHPAGSAVRHRPAPAAQEAT